MHGHGLRILRRKVMHGTRICPIDAKHGKISASAFASLHSAQYHTHCYEILSSKVNFTVPWCYIVFFRTLGKYLVET